VRGLAKIAGKDAARRRLTKIGEGEFDVRWTLGLVVARLRWWLVPSTENLARLRAQIQRAQRSRW